MTNKEAAYLKECSRLSIALLNSQRQTRHLAILLDRARPEIKNDKLLKEIDDYINGK